MSCWRMRFPFGIEQVDVRHEVRGHPRGAVGRLEAAQAHADARVVPIEEAARAHVGVVVRRRVDPRVALDDPGVPRVAGPLAVHHAGQQQDEGPVEHEAPDLARRPLLRGQRGTGGIGGHAERATPQHALRGGDGDLGRDRHGALLVMAERVDLARVDGPLPDRAPRRARARDETGDERGEQQRGDQHEPPGPEDVEEPSAVVEGAHQRMRRQVLQDAGGAARPLRDQRSGHGGQRQQQQQDQRRAHRAQGPPDEGDRTVQRGSGGGGGHEPRGF